MGDPWKLERCSYVPYVPAAPHILTTIHWLKQVLIAGGNYTFYALIDISFRVIQPLFYATPLSLGGLELPPPQIGKILALNGVFNALFQALLFKRAYTVLGAKKTFLLGISCGFGMFGIFPVLSVLASLEDCAAGRYGLTVWSVIVLQVVFASLLNFAYGTSHLPSMYYRMLIECDSF
jgi:hypothetical protein